MTSDSGIESRANRFAAPDAFGQSHIELGDIVGRVGRHPFRHPAVFARNGQFRERPAIASRSLEIELLTLHGSTRSGSDLEVAVFPVDLEQEFGSSLHTATDLE